MKNNQLERILERRRVLRLELNKIKGKTNKINFYKSFVKKIIFIMELNLVYHKINCLNDKNYNTMLNIFKKLFKLFQKIADKCVSKNIYHKNKICRLKNQIYKKYILIK